MKMLKALVLGATLVTANGAMAQDADYVLNTASTGGTYHPVGTAISTLSKVRLLPGEGFSLRRLLRVQLTSQFCRACSAPMR